MRKTSVHLIEGPIGAGKSTFAMFLTSTGGQGSHIALDEWFAALYAPDRAPQDFIPWYMERKDRLLGVIWSHSQRLLDAGCNVVLELGLIQKTPRVEFCRMVQSQGYRLIMHVLDAPTEIRRDRVRRRNQEKGATFSMVVPDPVFELANRLCHPPDELECSEFAVEFVHQNANSP